MTIFAFWQNKCKKLTFQKCLIFNALRKSYKNALKKYQKNYHRIKKNVYLCSVLINK